MSLRLCLLFIKTYLYQTQTKYKYKYFVWDPFFWVSLALIVNVFFFVLLYLHLYVGVHQSSLLWIATLSEYPPGIVVRTKVK